MNNPLENPKKQLRGVAKLIGIGLFLIVLGPAFFFGMICLDIWKHLSGGRVGGLPAQDLTVVCSIVSGVGLLFLIRAIAIWIRARR